MEACLTHLPPPCCGDLFPFDQVRGGQAQFLEDARMCLSTKTNLLAHAPTGIGKTAVSLSAAMEALLQQDGVALFLTARHSQHAIAIETMRSIAKKRKMSVVDLISRDDMCLARKGKEGAPCTNGGQCFFSHSDVNIAASMLLDSPMHVRESMRACLKLSTCPHRAAMAAARKADLVICDYNQVFSPNNGVLINKLNRPLKDVILIIDEGHNLPQRIMENGSGYLSIDDVQHASASTKLKRFGEDLDVLHKIVSDVLSRFHDGRILKDGDIDDTLKLRCGVDTGGLAEEMSEILEQDGGEQRELIHFLDIWNKFGDSSVRYVDTRRKRIVCKLIDPSALSKPIFDAIRSTVIMSGTLHPPEMFADILGVNRCVCRRYPSPFPPENRIVIAVRGVSSRYRLRSQAMYRSVAEQIARICESVPGNVAAFFPSYDFLAQVESFLAVTELKKRVVAERREYGRNEKEAIMASLKMEKEALLLASISGSFSEGVDFKNNILSAVIIVGFPISPPSLEANAIEERVCKRFGRRRAELYTHIFPAISKVLQAAGRPIRSERDRAAIILLDDRYLIPMIRSSFPSDFEIERGDELEKKLATFFLNGRDNWEKEGVCTLDNEAGDQMDAIAGINHNN